MVRIDRLDKLDRINYYSKMHCHLVKWWNVNMVTPDSEEENSGNDGEEGYDPDAEAEKLIMEALGEDAGSADVSSSAETFGFLHCSLFLVILPQEMAFFGQYCRHLKHCMQLGPHCGFPSSILMFSCGQSLAQRPQPMHSSLTLNSLSFALAIIGQPAFSTALSTFKAGLSFFMRLPARTSAAIAFAIFSECSCAASGDMGGTITV